MDTLKQIAAIIASESDPEYVMRAVKKIPEMAALIDAARQAILDEVLDPDDCGLID